MLLHLFSSRKFILALLLSCWGLQLYSEPEQIQQYLDSCTKYLKNRRPELVVQFNLKADAIAQQEENLSYESKFKIQSNYVWAFSAIGQQELKGVHLKKLLNLIQSERIQGKQKYNHYITTLGNIAGYYNTNGIEDSARKYFELAIQMAKEFNDTLYRVGSMNNMGLFIAKTKGWDKAKPYFDDALELLPLKSYQDSVLYCSIRDNVADYYLEKNDSAKAVSIVEENLKILYPTNRSAEKLMRWGKKILPYYFNHREFEKAQDLINQLELLVIDMNNRWGYDNQLDLIQAEISLANAKKENDRSILLKDEQSELQREYLNFLKDNNASITQLINEYQAYYVDRELTSAEEEILAAESKVKQDRIIYITALSALVLIASLIFILFQRKIKIESKDNELKDQQLKIEALEREKLSHELEHKSKDFSKLLMQSTLQEDWGKYLIGRLKEMKRKGGDLEEDLKDLVLELKQKTSLYEKVHELQKGMEEVNTNFFENLQLAYPTLSKSERETCGLIRMNMNAKEIALLRNINPSSVRKSRQRIRHKMGLSPTDNLDNFIQAF